MPAFQEEIFGPVASVIVAKDETDAIAIANDSEFGLGSAVITRDLDRGRRIAAHELESGMSFVNDNVRSDARMPFGGLKHSGYGREVSRYGLSNSSTSNRCWSRRWRDRTRQTPRMPKTLAMLRTCDGVRSLSISARILPCSVFEYSCRNSPRHFWWRSDDDVLELDFPRRHGSGARQSSRRSAPLQAHASPSHRWRCGVRY